MKAVLKKLALVLLLSATSILNSGCAGDDKPQVAATQIPGPPSYLRPIFAPKMKVGDDIRVHNRRRLGIIQKLNSIVSKANTAWLKLQADAAGEK